MKLLLDTHIVLWAAGQPEKLSKSVTSILTAEDNIPFFSVVSLWEMVIKRGLGRDDFRVDPRRLRKMLVIHGYFELPVDAEHVFAVETLPLIHKDPFDRLLLAQARSEGMLLLTVDQALSRYGGSVLMG